MDDSTQIPALTSDQISSLTSVDLSSISFNMPSYTIGANGATGSYIYTTAGSNGTSSSYNWGNINNISSIGSAALSSGLHVKSDAEFEGDIKWKGRSLGTLLEKIESRLAILEDPSPEKLEKYAALKKAYEHYKLIEKLIGDD